MGKAVVEDGDEEGNDDDDDDDDDEANDIGNLGTVKDQIEDMNLVPQPAPVQDVVVNTFAEAATDSADITDSADATTIIDTTSPSFSTYSVAELLAWLTTTIKTFLNLYSLKSKK